MDGGADRNIGYMQQVIAWQPRLFAFVLSLTGNRDEGDKVLQNAKWHDQKQQAFGPVPNSAPGPCRSPTTRFSGIGRPSPRARRRFDRVLVEQLAAKMGDPAANRPRNSGSSASAWPGCRSRSGSFDPPLRRQFGAGDCQNLRRSVGSTSQTLYRIRGKLAECVKRGINAERRDET